MSWKSKYLCKETIDFTFDEVPYKQRPRVANGHAYTPQKTKNNEMSIALQFKSKRKHDMHDFDGEVKVLITVQRPISKSTPRRMAGYPDLKKPDGDNIAKVFCDALNGIAWKDDCQASDVEVRKLPFLPANEPMKVCMCIAYYKPVYVESLSADDIYKEGEELCQ